MNSAARIIVGILLGVAIFAVGVFVAVPKPHRSPGLPVNTIPADKGVRPLATPENGSVATNPLSQRSPKSSSDRTPRYTSSKDSGWIGQADTPVHDGPGLNQAVMVKLTYGRHIQVVEENEGWTKIRFDGHHMGWVQARAVTHIRPANLPDVGPEEAVKALEGFYDDITKKRLNDAYDRLSFEFKRSESFAKFEKGYGNLELAQVRVLRTEPAGVERFALYAEVLLTDAQGPKGYRGEFVATYEQGTWRLSQGTLDPVDITQLSPFTPTGEGTPNKPAFPDPTPTPGEDDEKDDN